MAEDGHTYFFGSMPQMPWKTVKVPTGKVKCLYCGVEFAWEETHPPSNHSVNGYPSPCEYIGKTPTIFEMDETPWVIQVVKEVPYHQYIAERGDDQ